MSAVIEELLEPGQSQETPIGPSETAEPSQDPASAPRPGLRERIRDFARRRPDACIVAALAVIVADVTSSRAAVQICDVMPERCYYGSDSRWYYRPPPLSGAELHRDTAEPRSLDALCQSNNRISGYTSHLSEIVRSLSTNFFGQLRLAGSSSY